LIENFSPQRLRGVIEKLGEKLFAILCVFSVRLCGKKTFSNPPIIKSLIYENHPQLSTTNHMRFGFSVNFIFTTAEHCGSGANAKPAL
jgi:hypothetical protein